MRVHLTLLFWIAAALPLACVDKQSSNATTKSDDVVLEIVTNASGMVYPKQGDILDFRLHESGRFEYDDYPEQPPGGTTDKIVITRKEAKVSGDDVKELIALAEQPDFITAKEHYPRLHPHVDDQWITTITFTRQGRSKKISAVDFWDMLAFPNDKAKYPASMVRLLERVDELKARATGKKSKVND